MTIARSRVTGLGNKTRLTGCFGQKPYFMIIAEGLGQEALVQAQLWEQGVERVSRTFQALPLARRARLAELTFALKEKKSLLQGIAEGGGGAETCASCGGACCVSGRYHFTAVDLLVYLVDGETLFTPRFASGLCPYLGETGCLILAPYRPFNCITFNCERIEAFLAEAELSRFYLVEGELRGLYGEIRSLFPERFMARALLNLAPCGSDAGSPLSDGDLTHGHH